MTTPRTLTPEIVPDIRPAAGHALLTDSGTARCECGEPFGNPATSLDHVGSAWKQHMATEG